MDEHAGNVTENLTDGVVACDKGITNTEVSVMDKGGEASAYTKFSVARLGDKAVDPVPLALVGLAISSLFYGLFCIGILEMDIVTLTAIASGGVAMLMGGLMGITNRNMFGLTGFTLLGLFWMVLSIIFYINGAEVLITHSVSICTLMVVWGTITLFISMGARSINLMTQLAFIVLAVMFLTHSLYSYGTSYGDLLMITGCICIIAGMISIYTAFGMILNHNYNANILPVGIMKD